ncbi:MAG TPA: hypothetical protein PKD55_18945, partial [Bellilinea sp.]|nr:hypothetical protein [Bellilinea sp.]
MANEEVIITAQKRTVKGKQVNALRRQGWLPGVVYGRHLEAFPIQMPAHETSLKLAKLTSSSLVTVDVEGEKHTAIVRDRQRDVIFGRLTHIDFLAVSLTEKLRTTVGLELTGEAPVEALVLFRHRAQQGVGAETLAIGIRQPVRFGDETPRAPEQVDIGHAAPAPRREAPGE